ncbi:MAG: pantoate--beta-alanine ligase [Deltaproteobacteria bacterium]|nr:pantoate--beta-alanine ligase [Deltaproteobacteria bacterium]
MTELIREIDPLRARLALARERGLRVGVVPTMGALHRGHLALIAEARRRAQVVVVTVFVNPTQFGPNEDFKKYPRTLEKDVEACRAMGAELVFAPENESVLYPPGDETRLRVPETTKHLEGAFRPTHFEGVATIVLKLFNVVGPGVAVFGRKDYQQLQVVTRMARDLFVPMEIVGIPTVREDDGLALSSRNAYLSPEDRQKARGIPEGLSAAVAAWEAGERHVQPLIAAARLPIAAGATSIDYVACADAVSMAPLDELARIERKAVLAIAARYGTTRLIDNVVLGEDPAPIG